jgi:hypothetical protein
VAVANIEEPTLVTFTPSHDAHVRAGRSTNYGDEDHLRARTGKSTYQGFLKFDVGDLSGPVQSATLRLFVVDGSNNGGQLSAVSKDEAGAVQVGEWVDFDVTAAISGAGTYSFGLYSESSNSVMYSSSEGGNPPQLVVESTPVTHNNDPPVADDQALSTDEDIAVAITLTGSDDNGDPLHFIIESGPANGTLSGIAPDLTYAPNENFNGPDSFSFKANDGFTDSEIATVSINVNPIDDPPVFTADPLEFSVPEIAAVPTTVGTITAVDPEGAAPMYSIVDGNQDGKFSIAPSSGVITTADTLDFEDTPNYTLLVKAETTGSNAASTAEVSILVGDVTPVITSFNPQIGNVGDIVVITGSGFAESSVHFNGIPADSTIDSETQIFAIVPVAATTGPITVTTDEGTGTSATVFTVRTAPTIAGFSPDRGSIGTEITLAGQGFTDVNSVSFNGVSASFQIDSDTQLRTTVPAGASSGPIRVTANVGTGESLQDFTVIVSTPTVTLNPIHDVYARPSNSRNYGDVDHIRMRTGASIYNSYLKFDVSGLGGPAENATLRLFVVDASNDGGSVYSVSNNYAGSTTPWVEDGLTGGNAPTIGGTILDSAGAVTTGAWVEFDVTDAISGNGIVSFGLSSGSSNSVMYSSTEGDQPPQLVIQSTAATLPPTLDSFTPLTGSAGTEVTLVGSNFTNVISVSFNGTSATQFTVDSTTQIRADVPAGASNGPVHVATSNGTATSASSFDVTDPPGTNPPVANDQSASTDEDTATTIILTGSDADGDSLSFSIEDGPSSGTLSGTVPNLTYTPNENFNGSDSFRFKVNDGTQDSPLATVSISVNAVNDPPVADDLSRTTTEDNAVSVLLSGSDVDGDALSYSVISGPSDGSLQGTAPNLTYTPDVGFVGTDSFNYQVDDGSSVSNIATVTVNVTQASDPVTVSFQDEVFPSPGYRGTRDTKLRGDLPDNVLGTSRKLEVDGSPDIATLLKWDISALPSGSFVQSASITFNVANTSGDEFEIYQALGAWTEAEASFNERQAGVPWQIAGATGAADRGSTVLGTVTSPSLGTVTIDLNSAGRAVVQSWIDNPSENWGLVIQDYSDSTTQDLEFSSREARDAPLRPKLTIVYAGEPVVDDPAAGFDIDLAFTDNRITSSQRQVFTQAADRWSEIITGDLPELTNSSMTIDDLRIEVSLSGIDGPGGVLGNAGPTYVRAGTFLPARGVIRIDEDDITDLESSGRFVDLIMHEMGHVLGIGSIWRSLGLLSGYLTAEPRFTGAAATAEYNSIFGLNESSVPVENTGGSGTRDSHWRESVVGNELRTGYLGSQSNPLSRVTAASLQDLGYEVNIDAADAFSPLNMSSSIDEPVVVAGHFSELLEPPIVLVEQPRDDAVPWQNRSNAADVNNDGRISPLDALQIINELNSVGAQPLPESRNETSPFFDVSGDNIISPLDALLVFNSLNQVSAAAEGDVLYVVNHVSARSRQSIPRAANVPTLSVDQVDMFFERAMGTSRPTDTRTSDRQDSLPEELIDSVWTEDTPFDLLFVE